jgi:hypothetical protein
MKLHVSCVLWPNDMETVDTERHKVTISRNVN